VSIIVPTRNETNRIKKCIKSLASQTYPKLEVLVVDGSSDNTPDVIKKAIEGNPRFRLIKQKKLPSDWIGKPHALQQGSSIARGKWLLFIDADTIHDPRIVENAVQYATANNLDMLSLMPQLICESFWEKVIQPIPMGLLLFLCPSVRINNPKSKAAAAFGPFILIRHSIFKKIGGYKKIRDKIVDDVELGKLVKHSGFRIAMINGQDMIKVRMYEKFDDMWEGWSKNIYWGLTNLYDIKSKVSRVLFAVAGLLSIFGIYVFPFLAVIFSFILALLTNAIPLYYLLFFPLTWMLITFIQAYVQKLYKGYPKYAPLSFLGGIVALGMFFNSACRTLSGKGVKWKGRTYSEKTSVTS
jgi:glycosyltransferase involved in cell wall biosynthesis